MTKDASSLASLRSIVEELDVDARFADRTDSLVGFDTGAPFLAVIGLRPADRTAMTASLNNMVPTVDAVELEPELAVDRLWHAAVMLTPADRALSHVEERVVAEGTEQGRWITVVVTGLSALGNLGQQEAAKAEIIQYRLRPLLAHRGVEWHFPEAGGEMPVEMTHAVRSAVLDPARRKRVTDRLAGAFASDLMDELGERLAARRQDQDRLSAARQLLVGQTQRLQDAIRTTSLQGRESLRSSVDQLDLAIGKAIEAALMWLRSKGTGPFPDISSGVGDAWGELVRCAFDLLEEHAQILRGEIDIAETKLRDILGSRHDQKTLQHRTGEHAPWGNERTKRALSNLRDVRLATTLQRVEERVRAEHEAGRIGSETSRAPGLAPIDTSRSDRARQLIDRAVGAASDKLDDFGQLVDPSDPETLLRGALVDEFEQALSLRIGLTTNAVGDAIQVGGQAEVDQASNLFQTLVSTADTAITTEHSWFTAYQQLLMLRREERWSEHSRE